MISSLQGKLEALAEDRVVINVGGIGFQVYTPTPILSTMGAVGEVVKLYTHLHVREDNLSLYGFGLPEELWLFQTLIGVSGLGPRLALAMLSAMSAEQITMAIATGSTTLLITIPGIGKKVAERIILELKDKIGAGWIATPTTQFAQENTDVLAALTSLGYSPQEAAMAVTTMPPATKLNLEEKIKLALQYLASK